MITPTDYRVNWTRSDEDYPAHTEEHGNVYPATPTHTLEGLDHDTEYKIRIRRTLLSQRPVRRSLERAMDGDHERGSYPARQALQPRRP